MGEHRFEVGSTHGAQVVLSLHDVVRTEDGKSINRYTCKCEKCGTVRAFTEGGLVIAGQRNGKRCRECPRNVNSNKNYECGDHCPTCYDLPHRRPKSKKCKCGKQYEPDTFTATEQDAHACANLWVYASQLLGADGFAGLEDWIT